MRKLLIAIIAAILTLSAQVRAGDGIQVSNDPIFKFTCSLNSLAASLTQCQAVPAQTGWRHYITDIVVQTTTATSGQFSVQSGTGTNCGTSTTAVFPSSGTANRFNAPINTDLVVIDLDTPIAVTAGHAVCVIGTATNTISIQIVGFTAP